MKKTFLKTTNRNKVPLVFTLILIAVLSTNVVSCSKDDDNPPAITIKDIPQNIKDLIYFSGDEMASTVLINVQAGPSVVLDDEVVNDLAPALSPRGILSVNVHQGQTLNPTILEDDDITLNQAINLNNQSVETLYQVVKHFKDEGRTIYLLGASFGAFITQELIAQKGIEVADKYLIITGRLDMNDDFWQALSEGRFGYFENGTTPVLDPEPADNVFERNEARLFASIIMNRYTERFSSIESLSNVTYIYGNTDEAVGGLTDSEVSFLESKNATVLGGDGDHDNPFDMYFEVGFNQAFGIEF